VEVFVKECGGTKVIRHVLIANNGISAVKAMRSMRQWAYKVLGTEKAIKFTVMATPEDMRINAEYIRLADQVEEVPGGSNHRNFANVDLIVDLSERVGADAVWAGWGHASENPRLPRKLSRTRSGVAFMGPPEQAMRDLGDKIASTLIAQRAKVPTVPWSGQDVDVDYERDGIPEESFQRACVKSLEELQEQVKRVGLPAMLKASEGGGGKGIRKIMTEEDVETAYRQVVAEVPGSPIFLMRMVHNCHHLEVQIVADAYHEVICLYGRDCSVQRRHQKVIEEAPAIVAPAEARLEMERAAIRLAKAVRYVGVGTIEYLFEPSTGKFYFLELNPRLQVEHPCTEQVTNVNLPTIQLNIAMGIPMHRIPDVRAFYGLDPFGVSPIDFATAEPLPPVGHVIATRITGENPSEGFKPTSGRIHQLTFRSAPNVWGYFSVSGIGGGLHEFADSQFGHLFAHGRDRDDARKSIILALKELSIRGDVHTPVEYLVSLLETEDFKTNNMDTSTLDGFIARKSIQEQKPDNLVVVLCGAVYKAYVHFRDVGERFLAAVDRGQMPSAQELLPTFETNLIYGGYKYTLSLARTGPSRVVIRRGTPPGAEGDESTEDDGSVAAEFRPLADNHLLIILNQRSFVCYGREDPSGYRFFIDDKLCLFANDYDPTIVRSASSGKLVRFLVEDGSYVKAGTGIAEMEVMKMYLPVVVKETGNIKFTQNEGAAIKAGDILATMVLEHESEEVNLPYDSPLPAYEAPNAPIKKLNHQLQKVYEKLSHLVAGYLPGTEGGTVISDILTDLLVLGSAPHMPFKAIAEQIDELSGRIPVKLSAVLDACLNKHVALLTDAIRANFKELFPREEGALPEGKLELSRISELWVRNIRTRAELQDALTLTATLPPFPGDEFVQGVETFLASVPEADRGRLISSVQPVSEIIQTFKAGSREFVFNLLRKLITHYCALEEASSGTADALSVITAGGEDSQWGGWGTRSEAIDTAFFRNPSSKAHVLMQEIINVVADLSAARIFESELTRLARLFGKYSLEVSLAARAMLFKAHTPSDKERIDTILTGIRGILRDEGAGEKASASADSPPRYTTVRDTEEAQNRMHSLVSSAEPMLDLIMHLFSSEQPRNLRESLIELYIHRLYRAFELRDLTVLPDAEAAGTLVWATVDFCTERSFHPVTPMRDDSGLLDSLQDSPGDASPHRQIFAGDGLGIESSKQCHIVVLRTHEELFHRFDELVDIVAKRSAASPVLHLVVLEALGDTSDDNYSRKATDFFLGRKEKLLEVKVNRITVTVQNPSSEQPDCFTFYPRDNFGERETMRHIEPTLAYRLELKRMSGYNIRYVRTGSRTSSAFYAEPKGKGGESRLFVRALVRGPTDNTEVLEYNRLYALTEQRLAECIKRLDVAMGKREYGHAVNNHIFLKILPVISYDPEALRAIIVWLGERYGKRLFRLKVSALELRCKLAIMPNEQPVPILFQVFNPTSYRFKVHAYVHARDAVTGEGTFVGLESQGLTIGPLHGMPVTAQYEPMDSLQRKRYFCQRFETTYAYDFMELFQNAVERDWRQAGRAFADSASSSRPSVAARLDGEGSENVFSPLTSRPASDNYEVSVQKLVERYRAGYGGVKVPKHLTWPVELVLSEDRSRCVPRLRAPGQNDIGVVAWLLHMYTPEYPDRKAEVPPVPLANFNIDDEVPTPANVEREEEEWLQLQGRADLTVDQEIWNYLEESGIAGVTEIRKERAGKGRWIVVIANDITHQIGSFGPLEDDLFFLASATARRFRIPRIYVSANSGARIGLATEVRDLFRVRWTNRARHQSGFEYLYFTDGEYQELVKRGEDRCVLVTREEGCGCGCGAETCEETGAAEVHHWRITDVVGLVDGIGVENLKGSGLIASETSRAYQEIFTCTLVTGRSVGIGAYLVRLGQRCVQNQGPIILTGAPALNKVLGRDVYTSNGQLGGPQIMYNNGVSHQVVTDDARGVSSVVTWLGYVPRVTGAAAGRRETADPITRPVGFVPVSGPYNPRSMLDALPDGGVEGPLGIFDRGSFRESLGGWAATVVCGRARLGGIPVGVIAVETRTQEEVIPADPATPSSTQEVRQQPGQVWFPNSAFKTAQAIADFNRGEELPLFIFANWRGFSGGMRDMYEEMLKYGAQIVDSLREYRQPVFVYLPPYAELRGGAWAVLDPSINENMMRMYADPRSRGGILEPSGTVEIKYRKRELLKTIDRLEKSVQEAKAAGNEKEVASRQVEVLPVYQQVAETFADLHDRCGRMMAKNCLHGVVEWEGSRKFFFTALRRRLLEENVFSALARLDVPRAEACALLREWMGADAHDDNAKAVEWITTNMELVFEKLQTLKRERAQKCAARCLASLKCASIVSTFSELLKDLPENEAAALRQSLKAALN